MKNAKIDLWFPTPIYVCDEIVSENYNDQIKQQILFLKNTTTSGGNNWLCDTYNTIGKYDLRQSECFVDLLKTVTDHVNNFASKFNTTDVFSCKESWFNIYNQNDYQEYHIHTHSTFSAVYYATAPLNSGDLVFENPFGVDMMEIQNITEQNNLTYKNCRYQVKERRLIIFKSHLKHMVMQGKNADERISIAFNYI